MKKDAMLIVKANTAEDATAQTRERFAELWSDWGVQCFGVASTSDAQQWHLVIKFPFDQAQQVGCELNKWYTDPDLSQIEDNRGYPLGTLLYYRYGS